MPRQNHRRERESRRAKNFREFPPIIPQQVKHFEETFEPQSRSSRKKPKWEQPRAEHYELIAIEIFGGSYYCVGEEWPGTSE